MSALEPNTPLLIAAAAVQQREESAGDGLEPCQLMVAALRKAAAEVAAPELLQRAQRIEVPRGLWDYSDPARLVAEAVGAGRAQTVLADFGILQQTLINRACNSICAGEAEVVLITGAETKYRALLGQREGVEISATGQTGVEPDVTLRPVAELWSEVETAAGLGMPVGYYAILDSALRHAQGLGVEEHRRQIAQMYAQFSEIAASNPDAWSRQPVAADFIRLGSPKNRMLAFSYTKLHNSQWNVDQGAGMIFCSVAVARELGIDQKYWVFPLAGTESNAMSVVAARRELDRCHGFRLAGQRVLELAGKTTADIDRMELYSCFPLAIRAQIRELGLPAELPVSVTGAMTFGGGPLNNFVLQATVKMAHILRRGPSPDMAPAFVARALKSRCGGAHGLKDAEGIADTMSKRLEGFRMPRPATASDSAAAAEGWRHMRASQTGLITCVSGMNTKQACALYSTRPNPSGWQCADVTAEAQAATELCDLVPDYAGEAAIAGYTVLYQGARPWRAVAVCDLPGGRRSVAYSEQGSIMEAFQREEYCGQTVTLAAGQFRLVRKGVGDK